MTEGRYVEGSEKSMIEAIRIILIYKYGRQQEGLKCQQGEKVRNFEGKKHPHIGRNYNYGNLLRGRSHIT